MNSTAGKLAHAIVGELNGMDLSHPFVAQWGFAPVYSTKHLQTLHVTVVPRLVAQETAARNLVSERQTVDVAVQRAVQVNPDDPLQLDLQVDEIVALADEIARVMTMRAIVVDQTRFQWVGCQRVVILQDQLLEEQVATSVVGLTYQASSQVVMT